jgi:catechol 2,3-dioxygenase
MGFKRVAQMAGSANFISTGGYHHHIGLNVWNGRGVRPAPENATGLRYYTLAAPDRETQEKILENLRDGNQKAEMKDGILHTQDPSGNRIQIIIA